MTSACIRHCNPMNKWNCKYSLQPFIRNTVVAGFIGEKTKTKKTNNIVTHSQTQREHNITVAQLHACIITGELKNSQYKASIFCTRYPSLLQSPS
jgi:hypothetical protein